MNPIDSLTYLNHVSKMQAMYFKRSGKCESNSTDPVNFFCRIIASYPDVRNLGTCDSFKDFGRVSSEH